MSLSFRSHFDLARTALKQRRGRTFLTCLGITIGVASIILILSLMGSISSLISNQLTAAGNNLIIIRPGTTETSLDTIVNELANTNRYGKSNLTLSDSNLIRNLGAPVTAVAPLAVSTNTLIAERTVNSGTVLGTTSDLQDILGLELQNGTFLTDSSLKTAVIGHDLSLELFGTTEPIGLTFSLLGEKFIITGVLTDINDPVNFNSVDFDNTVIVDITQLRSLESNLQVQQINVQVTSVADVAHTAETIRTALTEFKDGDTNYTIAYGESVTHPAGSLFSVVSGILTIVAGISLIVGGIGVMNIMLVAVSERTHEVGIRKAIGATNFNIFLQFLLESLILCTIGGISGIILGYVLAFLISTFTPFAPFFSLPICLIALGVSIVVGTIFGLYPAIKAARKNPIDSLKHYN